jgi:hypothetical protein
MKLLHVIKNNPLITIIIAILALLVSIVIPFYIHHLDVSHDDELSFKNNQPKVEVDSVFFPSKVGNLSAINLLITKPIDFKKLDKMIVLEVLLVLHTKIWDRSIRKIGSIFGFNDDSTFSLRKNILNKELEIDTTKNKIKLYDMYDNVYFKANTIVADTFLIPLYCDFTNPLKKYYIHYLFIYKSDAGGIYDIYYTRAFNGYGSELINPTQIKSGYEISPYSYCDPKSYSKAEYNEFKEYFKKAYGVIISDE